MFSKKLIFLSLLLFITIAGMSAVSAVDNITVDGDSVINGEVEMPTERVEIKFNDNDKTFFCNVVDERLESGLTNNYDYSYKVNNKTYSSGQGFISSPTVTMYRKTLDYYGDGEHNLIIHRNNHGTKTLLFNVTFDIKNSTSLRENITIQNTKTVKYSIKNGVILGSFPEEYSKLHEGWNNLTEYALLNTGMGATNPVILKVYYRPYMINNTDIRNLFYDDSISIDDENNGKIISGDTTQKYGQYNARIIAKDVTLEYGDYYELTIYIEDNDQNPIEMAEPYFEDYLNSEYDSKGYYYFFPMDMDVGTHQVEFTLDDGLYKAEPVTINLKIVPSTFYGDIKCKSYYGTDKTTLTMKATVYDPDYDCYEDGYVTFKVNGKSYTVKTKNGVATKKIKINKAGTYTYSAKFTNKNYKDSLTGKAKLYVYITSKKARTFNVKGYKIVVPIDKYNKLVNVKNTNELVYFCFKTNKFIKQKYAVLKNGKISYKTSKARVSIIFSYGGKYGGQYGIPNKYYLCLTTPYQNPGYDPCTPWLYGAKKSATINKLTSAKTTKW